MVQMDSSDFPGSSGNDEWTTDGLECVKLKFVRSVDDIENAESYEPEYVYQHFGDTEKIFGYKNLSVTIVYSAATLKVLPIIKYDSKIKESGIEADDILAKLKEQLPGEQMSMQVESVEEFRAALMKEDNFKPIGEKISQFSVGEETFEMFRTDKPSPEFDEYLARMQTLALWYINAAEYTDNEDEKWMHYTLFRSTRHTDGTPGSTYDFAGYASLYRFYAYPEHQRPRLAQMLLVPAYRRSGMGASFLQRIYSDLITFPKIKDITVEDPADNMILLRDYVDCVNCSTLPELAPEKLKLGFTTEMLTTLERKFKIGKRQARRIYEILRLRATSKKDKAEMAAYKQEVKRRLEAPMKRSDKEWKKMQAALDPEEINQMTSVQMTDEAKAAQLEQLFEQEMEAYNRTIERISDHPNII